MPRITRMSDLPVVGGTGKRLGTVLRVLFHESEPRVVGYEVDPVPWLHVIHRRPRFLPLQDTVVSADDESILVVYRRLPPPLVSSKTSGIDWDHTVVWKGMDMMTESGKMVGHIKDVVFSRDTGAVGKVILTEGVTDEIVVGRIRIESEMLVGFDGTNVVVFDEALRKETSGGLATATGTGTAVAKDALGRAVMSAAKTGGWLAGKAVGRFRRAVREWKEFTEE